MSTVAAAPGIPAGRVEEDPSRVAGGEPRGHVEGVPVYGWGQAPPYLRTQTQLVGERLKLAEGQEPLAYLRTRKYGDVPLYDPGVAVRMKPLGSSAKARMTERRTCPECGKVRGEIVRGGRCGVCRQRVERERLRLRARTCEGCGAVRERPYPKVHGRCVPCRQEQLRGKRERVAAWVEKVVICAGPGCAVRLGTKKAARAWLEEERPWLLRPGSVGPDALRPDGWSSRCPSCQAAEERRQAEELARYEERQAEQRARYEELERERREAERREAEERRAWAAAALADPDVVVLDVETTGLHEDARIVELSALTCGGETVLDTLVNPGVPIPAEASNVHGICDADVESAPGFSDVLVRLTGAVDGKRVLIYNKGFDVARLRHELSLHYFGCFLREAAETAGSVESAPGDLRAWALVEGRRHAAAWLDAMEFEDVMVPYSAWCGNWSEYHGDYRWQPLDGGHRAAGDCRAVLECLRVMARPDEDEDAEEYGAAALAAAEGGEGF